MKVFRRWGFDLPELLMVGYWAFWGAVLLLFGRSGEGFGTTLAGVVALTTVLGASALLTRGRGPLVRLGGRAVALVLLFSAGHSLTGQIARTLGVATVERRLAEIELAALGFYVTERVQAFNTPWLVEWLQVNYFLFLVFPLPLFVVLMAKKRWEDASEYASAVGLAMLVCFTGYIALPATTPALLFEQLGASAPIRFDGPLVGLWLTDDLSRMLVEATTNRNDAFPSGHTSATLMVLILAWRLHRRTFWCLLPTGLSIVYATLALRYHFAVDLVAGVLVGIALPWATLRLGEWWRAEGEAELTVPASG